MRIKRDIIYEKLKVSPTEDQRKFIDNTGKERALVAGRRWGKSFTCGLVALEKLLQDDKRIWIIAPNYELTEKVFNNYLLPFFVKLCPSQNRKGIVSMGGNRPGQIKTDW